jgi:cytochrome b561
MLAGMIRERRGAMPERYTTIARVLHWLTALLVLVQVVLGVWMTAFEPAKAANKFLLYDIHENIGFTLLLITLGRLAWRLTHPVPPLPTDLPAGLRLAARANHAAFYLLLIVQPITGFLATNAWGFPFAYLKLIPIPSPIGRHETLAPVLSAIHDSGALVFVVLVVLHASAALWHQFIRRDGTLSKML